MFRSFVASSNGVCVWPARMGMGAGSREHWTLPGTVYLRRILHSGCCSNTRFFCFGVFLFLRSFCLLRFGSRPVVAVNASTNKKKFQLSSLLAVVDCTYCVAPCLSSPSTQVTWDDLGMERSHNLMEGGADIPVTADNKEEYVELYANFLLSEAVSRQFDRFKQGFLRVMSGASSIALLR